MFLMEITFDTSLLIITYNLLCIKQQFECWLKFNHIFSKHLISQTNHPLIHSAIIFILTIHQFDKTKGDSFAYMQTHIGQRSLLQNGF